MQFPKALVAQRWQTWLLVTALLAVVVTGIFVWDLTRNLKSVIISETNRSLENAVKELSQELPSGGVAVDGGGLSRNELDSRLKQTSYETLTGSISMSKAGTSLTTKSSDTVSQPIQNREATSNNHRWNTRR